MHLIRFPNRKEHERAIGALLDVPREYQVLPGPQFVVTDDHVRALERAEVRFQFMSGVRSNGETTTSVQP